MDRQAESRASYPGSDEVFIRGAILAYEKRGTGTLGDREGGWTSRLPLAVALTRNSPDLRTDDVAAPRPNSATMPPSYPLGDVTGLLNVKVRPRLNKDLNHCHCLSGHTVRGGKKLNGRDTPSTT